MIILEYIRTAIVPTLRKGDLMVMDNLQRRLEHLDSAIPLSFKTVFLSDIADLVSKAGYSLF